MHRGQLQVAYAVSHQDMHQHAQQSGLVMGYVNSTGRLYVLIARSIKAAVHLCSSHGRLQKMVVGVHCATPADKATAGAVESQKPNTSSSD